MNQNASASTAVGDDGAGQRALAKGIAGQNMSALPQEFTPGENDVICGRGRKAFSHIGNERFRKLVEKRLDEYSNAVAKLEKSYILSDIVCEIRQKSPNGGFVKKDTRSGQWYEVGDFLAREKTSQAFRDALHDQYKSSNTAKKKRRQAEQAEKHLQEQSSSKSLSFEPAGYNMNGRGVMPVRNFEPSQDSLLGALDVEISASLAPKQPSSFGMSAQNSARSVVDFAQVRTNKMNQHSAMFNQSCPNLNWNPLDFERPSSSNHQQMHHSTPHVFSEYGTSDVDMMDVEPAFPDRQMSAEMDSDSFDDDLILSPIGDGSPRRLFNSLSQLNEDCSTVPF